MTQITVPLKEAVKLHDDGLQAITQALETLNRRLVAVEDQVRELAQTSELGTERKGTKIRPGTKVRLTGVIDQGHAGDIFSVLVVDPQGRCGSSLVQVHRDQLWAMDSDR